MHHINAVDTKKLFATNVPITIKDVSMNRCRNAKLFLTVEWNDASSTSLSKQELLVSMTDSNDPFFLYHLHLPEEDFQTLKTSQGLLVDFSSFPQKFIDLLELCLAEENKSTPKFLLVLNVNEKQCGNGSFSQLDVVETNPFKHLTHLSLKFIPASESSIKQYLATCFKNLKEEKGKLENRLSYLEKDVKNQLSDGRSALERKNQELEMVRKELSVELSMKESKHARELQEERERFLKKIREEELRSETVKREKEHGFRKEIQQLESRVTCLDTLNKELQDQNRKQNDTIRELRSSLLSLEEEVNRKKKSLEDYKEQNDNLNYEIKEKKKSAAHLKDKVDEFERDLAYKRQQIAKFQEQSDHFHKHKKALENELDDLKIKFHKALQNNSELSEDISKANNVIEKLQREIQTSHEKLKQRNILVVKHEQSFSEKDKIIQMMQKEMSTIKIDMKKKNGEMKLLTDSAAALQEKINNLEKDIKVRDNVIKYLNREIYDHGIIPHYEPPSNMGANANEDQTTKMQCAGDGCTLNNRQSPSADASEKPKTLPTRNRIPILQPNRVSFSPTLLQSTRATVDSAYASSPSYNTNNNAQSSPGAMSNPAHFQLDSEALNAAFGSGEALKHSTAKKQTQTRTTNSFRKKK